MRLLDDGDATEHLTVLREVSLDELEEVQVNIIDDLKKLALYKITQREEMYLKMARKEMLEERNRPLLERLGKNGMVGVTESL